MNISSTPQSDLSASREQATDHDLLTALLDGAPDHIYFKDRDSRFTKINRHMSTAFGFVDPADAVGKTDFDVFTEEHAAAAFQDEQRVMETGVPIIGKTERETWPNGRVTWVSSSKMPLRNRDGVIVGLFGISRDVTTTVEADNELKRVNKLLLQASRQAGMAEVATGVLHNVGNILNSANLSSSTVAATVEGSKLGRLQDLAALLESFSSDLPAFFSNDERGKQVPRYLTTLSKRLLEEQQKIREETRIVTQCLEHIKEIVSFQQNYAFAPSLRETISVAEVIDDAIRIHRAAFSRHGVSVSREIDALPAATIDKHKLLQILVNLLHNAKYACDFEVNGEKSIQVRAKQASEHTLAIEVRDTGIGIPPENLTRIFNHGFTTRKEGHGFGLHSSALAAADMGGQLLVHSDGLHTGATFTILFPLNWEGAARPREPRFSGLLQQDAAPADAADERMN